MAATVDLPYLMDIATLAEHLGVSVRHIRRLVHERRIPFIKWGHLIRFDPVEVHAWLEQCRHEPLRHAI
jgi:excisionase family DNA binding protein